MTAAERFQQDLENAIELREMFYVREIDRAFEQSEGHTLLYAVDSNILHSYFAEDVDQRESSKFDIFQGPESEAVSQAERSEGNAFSRERTIGAVVSHYILNSLGSDSTSTRLPLLLLPGHNVEASGLYEKIVGEFQQQQHTGRNARAILEDYLSETELAPTDDAKRKLIDNWEKKIYDVLYEISGPHERFRAYNSLLAREHLMKLDRAAQEKRLSHLRELPGKSHVFNDYMWTEARKLNHGPASWWDEQKVKDPWDRDPNKSEDDTIFIRSHYWRQDKLALSALDRINRLLLPFKARIVLFTSNGEILRAGRRYFPYKFQASPELEGHSFTDLYLRDPKCLLSEAAIIEPSGTLSPGSGKLEWLDAFLGVIPNSGYSDLLTFRNWLDDFRPALREQALQLLPGSRDQHRKLHAGWQNYVEKLLEAHSSASKVAIEGIEAILGKKGSWNGDRAQVLSNLNKFVTDLTEESWNNFFLTAAKSGLDLLGLSGDAPQRALPPLLLLGIEGSEELIEWISQPNGAIRNKERIVSRLAKLDDDMSDHVGYVRTLVYALLFAVAERWSVTELITQRACLIARRIVDSGNPQKFAGESSGSVTGREACYLGSIAHRLTARKGADLDECTNLINKAKVLEDNEKKLLEKLSPPRDPVPIGLRIGGEMIAIDASRLLFRVFPGSEPKAFETMHIPFAREIMKRITILMDKAWECTVGRVRDATRISLRSEYFMMAFIIDCCGGDLQRKERSRIGSYFQEQVADFIRTCRDTDGTLLLSVVDAHTCAYAASWAGVPAVDFLAVENFYRVVSGKLRERHKRNTMPYDRVCLEKMRALIEERRSSR